MSSISSEGVTLPSSLIRTHAPDQIPPADFRFILFGRSLQVAVSPCWKMALPDVISTICAKSLGPLPRRVPVDLSIWAPRFSLWRSDLRTSASPKGERARHAKKIPVMQLQQGGLFRGCSHSLMFRLLCSLGPPVAPTAVPRHRAAGPFTSRNEHVVTRPDHSRFYMNRDIATYLKRTN
jgi:hypothetical protein